MGRDRWRVDYFQSDSATQYLVPGEIGNSHAAATEFPVRTICALLDLEITED